MKSLKKIRLGILLFLICGCTSSSYFKVTKTNDFQVEMEVTPDRILLQCERLEETEFYYFSIELLDEEQTVTTIFQANKLTMDGCDRRMTKIGKMIKEGERIYIGAVGTIDDPRKKTPYFSVFPEHGKFNNNGRVLQFMVIMNEKKDCFHAYQEDDKPCPRDKFPIK